MNSGENETAFRLAFAGRLEAIRRGYGRRIGRPRLTRTEFAEALGIERARYARYERAETEPPLQVLRDLRRITGISLDWLVAGMARGNDHSWSGPHRPISLGDRLRWARETQEPWLNACAAVMGTTAAEWQSYEEDRAPLPVALAAEFAHRFSVTLDYLYRGEISGVAAPVLRALLEAHPELHAAHRTDDAAQPAAPADDPSVPHGTAESDTRTAMDDGNKSRSKAGSVPARSRHPDLVRARR